MSIGGIGGDYGADSQASNALVAGGVSVVASAGNEGPNAYMTGSPGNATERHLGCRVRRHHELPRARSSIAPRARTSTRSTRTTTRACRSAERSGPILDDADPAVEERLGCTEADYGTLPANSIAIIQRGVCTFVEKGAAAEAAGAIGVIVVNRDDIVDPNEPPTFIGYTPLEFDIPMIGVGRGAKATLFASDGVGGDAQDRAGDPERDVPPQRRLHVGRSPPRRQRQQARRERARREHRVDGGRARLQGHHPLGHLDGIARTWPASPPSSGSAIPRGAPRRSRRSSSGRPSRPRSTRTTRVSPARAWSSRDARSTPSPSCSPRTERRACRSATTSGARAPTPRPSRSRSTTWAAGPRHTRSPRTGIVKLDRTTVTIPAHGHRTIRATASLNAAQLAASQVGEPDRSRRNGLGQPRQLRRRDHGHADRPRATGRYPHPDHLSRRSAGGVEHRAVGT